MARNFLARDWHIFKTYLLARQRRPFLASYKLTYRCNLRCQQCPFYNISCPDPSFPQVCATLDQLYRRGSRLVIFEGGEPMLWRDGARTIQDVLGEARRRFFCVGITTNGTWPLDVPADVVWVSLDGFATTHNQLRGAPIFERVIAALRAAQHPRLYAHLTANRLNAPELPALVRFLHGLVKGITVQFYYPYNFDDALFLDFPARRRLLEELIELKRQGYPILNSFAALQALQANTWRCVDWLVDNANPDGSLAQGCYLRGRADIDCARCGFSPHTELSLAYQGHLQSIAAGIKIFF